MTRTFLLPLVALSLSGSGLVAQSDTTPDTTFFTRHDLTRAGVTLLASAALSAYDVKIARWSQSSAVQGDSARARRVRGLTWINETPLTIASVATWGIGRLTRNETLADVGLHTTEAMVITIAASELIRVPLGRGRPWISPDDQYNFRPFLGLRRFEYRAFPSLHAAAAFAAAAATVGELQTRNSSSVVWVAPVLYGIALVPGFTRVYLNEHWASDLLAGAVLGQLIGSRVVHYAHSHKATRFDRALLSLRTSAGDEATVLIGVDLAELFAR